MSRTAAIFPGYLSPRWRGHRFGRLGQSLRKLDTHPGTHEPTEREGSENVPQLETTRRTTRHPRDRGTYTESKATQQRGCHGARRHGPPSPTPQHTEPERAQGRVVPWPSVPTRVREPGGGGPPTARFGVPEMSRKSTAGYVGEAESHRAAHLCSAGGLLKRLGDCSNTSAPELLDRRQPWLHLVPRAGTRVLSAPDVGFSSGILSPSKVPPARHPRAPPRAPLSVPKAAPTSLSPLQLTPLLRP